MKRFNDMARWKILISLWLISIMCMASFAQSDPRDYSVSAPTVTYAEDGTAFTVEFTITNNGGNAANDAQIIITQGNGIVKITDTLPPLTANQAVTVEFPFQMAGYEMGVQAFFVEVGIDQFELAGSPIARDNRKSFSVTITEPSGSQVTDITVTVDGEFDFVIPVLEIGFKRLDDGLQINQNIYSTQDILKGAGIGAVSLVLLWFFTLILRLLFRRKPVFGNWTPPYAQQPYYDPNSTLGRRNSWQHHAQNGTIFESCTQNNVVSLKRLLDMDGDILGEWDIKAIRTVQYDMYGRINRTEVIMPSKIIKKLNKVARRAQSYDNPKLKKAVQPIAKSIAKLAGKPISKKSAMLPIAMDLRFEGKHGEVRIMFELYQCRDHSWHLIDQWEPEMAIVGHKIIESYTYTLNGQLGGESYKDYKRRLVEDVAWLLGGMLYRHQQPATPEPDMVPPDTLTGMAPITEGNMPPIEAGNS
jgi:hypothetical protein